MSFWNRLFKRDPVETRAKTFTDIAMDVRAESIAGRRGLAELTGTAQGCISMWEHGLSLAEVKGAAMLSPRVLSLAGRSLGLRGEAVFVIRGDRLVPACSWDVTTRGGVPRAYRVEIPDTGGARADTVLADEVLHIVIGSDPKAPWSGQAPLRRASLTANLLHAIEDALADTYATAPLGSQIAPMPESENIDNEKLAASFRGQRGRVLLRESVNVAAAGGPAPVNDWKPSDLSPDLSRSMTAESLSAARDSISYAFGVLPALMDAKATGPVVREAQRHLAQWQLQPIAAALAEEASAKLGAEVQIDVMQPLQAYDAGGRARALSGVLEALATAKQGGLSQDEVAAALKFAGVTE